MISAIILAAGQSKRLIKENKLLKIYKKKPLLNHAINSVIKSKASKIIIVLGYESNKVKKFLSITRPATKAAAKPSKTRSNVATKL